MIGTIAVVVVVVVIATLLTSGPSESPEAWLDEHYTSTGGTSPEDGGLTWSSDDDLDTTARAIGDGTEADELRSASGSAYLRYESDWMVEISESVDGSEITLYEFDEGYDRHGSAVFFWSSHYNRGGSGFFRGGGSGFGK